MPHSLGRTQDRLAQRMIAPEILYQQFVDQVFGVVLIHLDFLKHDLFFARDFLAIEKRAEHQIGEHFPGQVQVFVKDLGIEADHLLGGVGVHHAAN